MRGLSTWRVLPLLVLVGAGLIALLLGEPPQQIMARLAANREWLQSGIGQNALIAASLYALIYAALMTLLFVPAWLCSTIAGYLFGIWIGVPVALTGATLGAMAVFALARYGLAALTRHAGPFVRKLEAEFRRDALSYLLVLRLLPVVPFSAINVVSAIFGVAPATFAISTFLGIIPSTLVYVGLGDAFGAVSASEITLDNRLLLNPRFALPLFGLAVLALLPVLRRRMSAHWQRK
jgi:uncharacterized membrane protein YdjX (TVP38/TMEM64 family)